MTSPSDETELLNSMLEAAYAAWTSHPADPSVTQEDDVKQALREVITAVLAVVPTPSN